MKKDPIKILLAPDTFKGSLSAQEVCEAIARGLKQKSDAVEIISHPMSDGGEGTLDILSQHMPLEKRAIETVGPLGRPLTASYYISPQAAFIELASASGHILLSQEERNPMYTSTLGTGNMLSDALAKGYQQIYLFLGGSATTDAGIGIAAALGFQFLDEQGNELKPIGKNLFEVNRIQNNTSFDLQKINITLLCDVSNPLYGPNGSAHVYAPQKGANAEEVLLLDNGLQHIAKHLQEYSSIDVNKIPGTGAAGGVGAALVALFGAQLKSGFQTIAQLTDLETQIKNAGWVISGEGRLDEQSLQGKVVHGVAGLCQKHQKPLALFVGKNELDERTLLGLNNARVYSISSVAENFEDAMANGGKYLEILAKESKLT